MLIRGLPKDLEKDSNADEASFCFSDWKHFPMVPKSSPQNCPQCGSSLSKARMLGDRYFCSGCKQELVSCPRCRAANLVWSAFCHNCGTPMTGVPGDESKTAGEKKAISPVTPESGTGSVPQIERMRLCVSCNKAIGEGERFCSYCGAKQIVLHPEPQTSLDPYTMKAAVTMLARITEAKDHSEYSAIDQLTTMIAEVALGKEKPHDANELPFSDQLRLLTLVFEYTRDKVGYKGEAFGEYVRWPWETIKTGGDCDCKVVLLATMLASLAFRRMHLLVLPPGTYHDTREGGDRRMQGHVMLEVELSEKNRMVRVMLDPSCQNCDVDEVPEGLQPFLQNLYRIPVIA